MDFKNVDYSFLTAAHVGFKSGLDKDHPRRLEIIAAIEKEIIKRRQRYVDLSIQIAEGTSISAFEVPAPSFAPPPAGVDPILAAAMRRDGITRLTNSKGDTITGYKPSRPSYPYSYTGARGGRWKASPEQIKAKFG